MQRHVVTSVVERRNQHCPEGDGHERCARFNRQRDETATGEDDQKGKQTGKYRVELREQPRRDHQPEKHDTGHVAGLSPPGRRHGCPEELRRQRQGCCEPHEYERVVACLDGQPDEKRQRSRDVEHHEAGHRPQDPDGAQRTPERERRSDHGKGRQYLTGLYFVWIYGVYPAAGEIRQRRMVATEEGLWSGDRLEPARCTKHVDPGECVKTLHLSPRHVEHVQFEEYQVRRQDALCPPQLFLLAVARRHGSKERAF